MNRLAALGLALASLVACQDAGSPSRHRRTRSADGVAIGIVLPLTGPLASYGVSSKAGIELALQQQNDSGGLRGGPVRAIFVDGSSGSAAAQEAARRLIVTDHVSAIIGALTTESSRAMAAVATRGQTPMITPSATAPEITAHGAFVFRTCFTEPFQAQAMAEHAKATMKLTKVAVVRDVGAAYSVLLADGFEAAFEKGGGTIVHSGTYSADDENLEAVLTPALGAEAIYIPGYVTEIETLAREARRLGFKGPLLGSDGWDARRVLELGAIVEGSRFTTHFAPDEPRAAVAEFTASYRRVMNESADAMAALGYDTTRFLMLAIQRADSADREAIREALAAAPPLEGVTGRILLDAHRNASKPAVVVEIRDGAAHFVEAIGPFEPTAVIGAPD